MDELAALAASSLLENTCLPYLAGSLWTYASRVSMAEKKHFDLLIDRENHHVDIISSTTSLFMVMNASPRKFMNGSCKSEKFMRKAFLVRVFRELQDKSETNERRSPFFLTLVFGFSTLKQSRVVTIREIMSLFFR